MIIILNNIVVQYGVLTKNVFAIYSSHILWRDEKYEVNRDLRALFGGSAGCCGIFGKL